MMKRILWVRLAGAAMALCSLSFMVVNTAHAEQSDAQASNAYRDYLRPSSFSLEVGGSGSEQCGTALSERVGQWVCPVEPSALRNRPGVSAATGSCDAWACRQRYDDFNADASAAGYWGWGGNTLGRVDVYAEYQLAGAQTWSKPVTYTNSAATTNVVFTGDLLNSAPGAEGSQVEGAFSLYNAGNIPAGTYASWNPNGYKSYDNKNWDHSQVHQWSFNAPGYEGYWYIYVKSTCTHTSDKSIYRFDAVDQVPANPDGAGWRQ